MAGVLRELGDWDAAEDAYTLVIRASAEHYYRVYAFDGLAYVAALRGDTEGFDRWSAECDALDWDRGPAAAKAEILCFRGLGYARLGRDAEAEAWLSRAVAFAAERGFARTLFRAEEGLEALRRVGPGLEGEATPAPPEVREGLRSLRRAMATA